MRHFALKDPFNPQNTVEGWLLEDEEHYGDLKIEHVNGRFVPQYIHTTPKFYYPYKSMSMYTRDEFNRDVDELRVYRKLDGSNIFTFSYRDADGNEYISFKSRLSPFLRNNRYFPLFDLFKEAGIPKKVKPGTSFELYGYRAQILIPYKVPIAIEPLFRLDEHGNIFPLGTPVMTAVNVSAEVLEHIYKQFEHEAEARYLRFKDTEGYMFYCRYGDKWEVYKCKSESAVKDNNKANTISYEECLTTAANSEKGTLEDVQRLLSETYPLGKVYSPGTMSNIAKALDELKFRRRVLDALKEENLSLDDDLVAIMRRINVHFSRGEMNRVYAICKVLKEGQK